MRGVVTPIQETYNTEMWNKGTSNEGSDYTHTRNVIKRCGTGVCPMMGVVTPIQETSDVEMWTDIQHNCKADTT